jgi:xylulokinase
LTSNKILLGIDIGTQAVKVLAVGLDGRVLAQTGVERGPQHPHPGWVEMDAGQDLWGPVVQCLQKLFGSSDINPQDIGVVGVCALVPCLCALDEVGNPVGKVILYSDNRALEELEWVNQTAGLNLTAEAVIPKLVWIRSHHPELFKRIHTIFSVQNFVVYRMTGARRVDYDTAGILGGIFNPATKTWREDVFKKLDLPFSFLPQLSPATGLVGTITSEASQQTGLPVGIPVIAGTGDTFPTIIGCGVIDVGDAMVSYGTTGLLTLAQKPLSQSAGGPHFDDGRGEASVAWVANILSAGRLVRWYCEQFGQMEHSLASRMGVSMHDLLDAQAGRLLPGADGLIVLPHWLGRRTPTPNAYISGAMIGFTPSHTPAHIYRAILEAFAYNMRQSFEAVRPQVKRIVATAGGARSRLWRQIVTDILKEPMEYYPSASGALGIAFLAGYAAGLIKDFQDIKTKWLQNAEITVPDSRVTPVYDRYFEVYCDFDRQMTEPFAKLAQTASNLSKKD